MKKSKSLYHGHRFPAGVISCAVRWYMTLRVNRDSGFQIVESTHEFPEGGAAVSLDGGSHFYERQIVKGFP